MKESLSMSLTTTAQVSVPQDTQDYVSLIIWQTWATGDSVVEGVIL